MKKVLEGELLSIAHRILQMKDKEDVSSLYYEAKEVYEKLFILKFYHENQEVLKKSLSQDTLEKQLELATKVEDRAEVSFGSASKEKSQERSQMPIDLIEEEYPIVVEQEEGTQAHIKTDLMREEALKINTEIEITDFDKKIIHYENQFMETPFDASIEENEEDQLIHQYLDQHEAMLKNQELKHTQEEVWSDESEEGEIPSTLIVEEDFSESELSVSNDVEDAEECEIRSTLIVEEDFSESEVPVSNDVEDAEEHEIPSTLIVEEDFSESELPVSNDVEGIEEQEIRSTLIVEEDFSESELPVSMDIETSNRSTEDPFAGFDFGEVDFVRVDEVEKEAVAKFDLTFKPVDDTPPALEKEEGLPVQSLFDFEKEVVVENKQKSLNDIYNSTITVGLNDRIGFENHLFNGSAEDLNRVLSQLNTVNSWDEATHFIEELVKPDYNNWEGKEAYETRFMELVAKRFI